MPVYDTDPPAVALAAGLISPNESDSNGEAANVVDGLFAVARSIDGLAQALQHALDPEVQMHNAERLAQAITRIAHGGIDGPTGLEAVSMTINGGRNGDWPSVTGAIREGFEALAEVIRDTSQ